MTCQDFLSKYSKKKKNWSCVLLVMIPLGSRRPRELLINRPVQSASEEINRLSFSLASLSNVFSARAAVWRSMSLGCASHCSSDSRVEFSRRDATNRGLLRRIFAFAERPSVEVSSRTFPNFSDDLSFSQASLSDLIRRAFRVRAEMQKNLTNGSHPVIEDPSFYL